jgi:hypothetical protein
MIVGQLINSEYINTYCRYLLVSPYAKELRGQRRWLIATSIITEGVIVLGLYALMYPGMTILNRVIITVTILTVNIIHRLVLKKTLWMIRVLSSKMTC